MHPELMKIEVAHRTNDLRQRGARTRMLRAAGSRLRGVFR